MKRKISCLALGLPLALTACPGDDTTEDSGQDTESGGTTMGTAPTASSTMTASTTTPPDTDTTMSPTTGGTEPMTDTDVESSSSTGPGCDPDVVELPGDMFFPEGIDADSNGTLYVGSLISGEILAITPCTGAGEQHIIDTLNDGADTMSAVGVLVDEGNSALWVCSSDVTGVSPPEILGFSLDDGSLLATHTIDGGFCNDLALDDDGNLYATESFMSRIMRVDVGDLLSDTAADEWSTDTLYQVGVGEFGLNGIAFDGIDVIYTVNLAEGEMYSTVIQGNGNAANPTLVDLGGTVLEGADGLELEDADIFLVVENGAGRLSRITLDGGGNSVETVDDTFDVPTTVVAVDGSAWVVESQLDHLMDPDGAGPPELPFVIVRRDL